MELLRNTIPVGGERVDHHFLCHYKSKSAGGDRMSSSLLRFKSGWPIDRDAWSECAIEALRGAPLPDGTMVIRALGSDELKAEMTKHNSLDYLGYQVQKNFDVAYVPAALVKSRSTLTMKYLSKAERATALTDVYGFTLPGPRPPGILILDDVLTTGATARAIMTSVRKVEPTIPLRVFTLALAADTSWLNSNVRLEAQSYEWEHDGGWSLVAEEQMQSLSELKKSIRDGFTSL